MAGFDSTTNFAPPAKKPLPPSPYTAARTASVARKPPPAVTPPPLTAAAVFPDAQQPPATPTLKDDLVSPTTDPSAPVLSTGSGGTMDGIPVEEWLSSQKSFQDYKAEYERFWQDWLQQPAQLDARNPSYFHEAGVKEDLMSRMGWYNPAAQVAQLIEDEQGTPIATGYWIAGEFYVLNNLLGINKAKTDLDAMETPTLNEFMEREGYEFQDITESEAWNALSGVVDTLMDPAQQQDWLNAGINQAEQFLGYDPGTYGDTLGGMRTDQADAMSRFQTGGLSDLQNRDVQSQIAQARDETKLILESLGEQGRGVQALMAADEISSSIGNLQIQAQLKYMEQNQANAMSEWAALEGQYNQAVQVGMMSATEYIQRQRENAALRITQYASEITMIEAANRQYLTQYGTELAGLEAHAQAIINSIQVDLGTDQALIDQMSEYYEMALAPIQFRMEQLALQMQQDALDAAASQSMWSEVIGLIGMGTGALLGNPGLFD